MSQRQVLNRLGEPTSRIGINNVTNWYWEQLDRKIVVTFSKSSPVVALHGRMEVVGGPSISLRQDQEILDLIRDLLP